MSISRSLNLLRIFGTLLWILCSNSCVFAGDLPPILRDLKCPLTEDFDSCFVDNGNTAIRRIAKGVPEIGLPAFSPLKLPFVSLVDTPLLQVNLTNVEVHGLDKMNITGHKTDIEKGLFTSYIKGDNITLVGDYVADGTVLLKPFRGRGRFTIYCENGEFTSKNTVGIIEKDGEEYFNPTNNEFHADFGRIAFNFENLFDGNKFLSDKVNTFLNLNWRLLKRQFGPHIGKLISGLDYTMFKKLASVVPLKYLYI